MTTENSIPENPQDVASGPPDFVSQFLSITPESLLFEFGLTDETGNAVAGWNDGNALLKQCKAKLPEHISYENICATWRKVYNAAKDAPLPPVPDATDAIFMGLNHTLPGTPFELHPIASVAKEGAYYVVTFEAGVRIKLTGTQLLSVKEFKSSALAVGTVLSMPDKPKQWDQVVRYLLALIPKEERIVRRPDDEACEALEELIEQCSAVQCKNFTDAAESVDRIRGRDGGFLADNLKITLPDGSIAIHGATFLTHYKMSVEPISLVEFHKLLRELGFKNHSPVKYISAYGDKKETSIRLWVKKGEGFLND